jgi:hypothetical protein
MVAGTRNERQVAFERGRQSVRDGKVGNPYKLESMLYAKFDEGVSCQAECETEHPLGQEGVLHLVQ